MHNIQRAIGTLVAMSPLIWACGATFPVPTQRMADAQSAERSALELGASTEPQAQLSLGLAQEQMAQARKAIADGDNERADALLIRANADAELAIAIARERNALVENQKAAADSTAQRDTNVGQGAVK
ncbi:MAG TPA: DUF4398 domain-containing protein [Polyangiaceae bacterium]